jgi:hypothetical protein
MPQEELDLLQLASRSMTELSTSPSQICGANFGTPMLLADSFTMCQTAFTVIPSPHALPTLLTRRNSLPRSIAAAAIVQLASHPIENRDRSNVASLADQINNCPMFFALLEVIYCQGHDFMPPQPTRE